VARPHDVEVLPPDPDWEPTSGPQPVVYEVEPPPPGVTSDVKEARAPAEPSSFRHGPSGARVAGDPRVLARMLGLGWKVGLVLAGIAFLVWALKPFGPETVPVLVDWMRASPLVGRALVVLGIAAGVPFFVPVGPLAFIPGYVWGTVEGLALTLLGASLGGLVNFFLSRKYIGPHVLAWTRQNRLASVLYDTIDARGLRVILGLRLSPMMPFGLLCYLSGLVSVPWPAFAVVVTLGGAPWTSVYAILGGVWAASNQPAALGQAPQSPFASALMWFGLAVTIGLAVWIGRVARRGLVDRSG